MGRGRGGGLARGGDGGRVVGLGEAAEVHRGRRLRSPRLSAPARPKRPSSRGGHAPSDALRRCSSPRYYNGYRTYRTCVQSQLDWDPCIDALDRTQYRVSAGINVSGDVVVGIVPFEIATRLVPVEPTHNGSRRQRREGVGLWHVQRRALRITLSIRLTLYMTPPG